MTRVRDMTRSQRMRIKLMKMTKRSSLLTDRRKKKQKNITIRSMITQKQRTTTTLSLVDRVLRAGTLKSSTMMERVDIEELWLVLKLWSMS